MMSDIIGHGSYVVHRRSRLYTMLPANGSSLGAVRLPFAILAARYLLCRNQQIQKHSVGISQYISNAVHSAACGACRRRFGDRCHMA